MKTQNISLLSKVLLLVVGLLFFASLQFPMWQIELEAPQYPEGLILRLHADKIGGDVEIINGLNHYIGMKTLHTEDFFEFQILTYIVIFFGVFALAAMVIAKRKLVIALLISLISFVVLAGIDFYRWNYEYGHNLDPNAAIKVPGMAYQPPVIGYKQLLNFGAYSVPDVGGWILIIAGTLIFIVVIMETKLKGKFRKQNKVNIASLWLLLGLSFSSCNNTDAQDINIHKDRCNFCEMTIADSRFGAEVITKKGRAYKFDDLICLLDYISENSTNDLKSYFVNDYSEKNVLIDATQAFFVESSTLKTPMRGNIAAFKSKIDAQLFADKVDSYVFRWADLLKK